MFVLNGVFITLAVWIVIKFFNTIDKSVDFKISNLNAVMIIVGAVFCSYFSLNRGENIIEQMQLSTCSLFLIIQAYTDYYIKQVYSIVNYLFMIINVVLTIINLMYTKKVDKILLPLVAVLVLGIIVTGIKGIGKGDVYVYIILLFAYMSVNEEAYYLLILFNIIISNLSFIIFNIEKMLMDKGKRFALLPFVMLAWMMLLPIV